MKTTIISHEKIAPISSTVPLRLQLYGAGQYTKTIGYSTNFSRLESPGLLLTIRATHSSADSEGKSTFKFFNALAKSRSSVFGKLTSLFSGSSKVDPAKIEELEDALILSDIGHDMSVSIIDSVTATLK